MEDEDDFLDELIDEVMEEVQCAFCHQRPLSFDELTTYWTKIENGMVCPSCMSC